MQNTQQQPNNFGPAQVRKSQLQQASSLINDAHDSQTDKQNAALYLHQQKQHFLNNLNNVNTRDKSVSVKAAQGPPTRQKSLSSGSSQNQQLRGGQASVQAKNGHQSSNAQLVAEYQRFSQNFTHRSSAINNKTNSASYLGKLNSQYGNGSVSRHANAARNAYPQHYATSKQTSKTDTSSSSHLHNEPNLNEAKYSKQQSTTTAANKENKPLNLSLTKTFVNFEARMIQSKTGLAPTSASNQRQTQQNSQATQPPKTLQVQHPVSNIKYMASKHSSQSSTSQLLKNQHRGLQAPEIISNPQTQTSQMSQSQVQPPTPATKPAHPRTKSTGSVSGSIREPNNSTVNSASGITLYKNNPRTNGQYCGNNVSTPQGSGVLKAPQKGLAEQLRRLGAGQQPQSATGSLGSAPTSAQTQGTSMNQTGLLSQQKTSTGLASNTVNLKKEQNRATSAEQVNKVVHGLRHTTNNSSFVMSKNKPTQITNDPLRRRQPSKMEATKSGVIQATHSNGVTQRRSSGLDASSKQAYRDSQVLYSATSGQNSSKSKAPNSNLNQPQFVASSFVKIAGQPQAQQKDQQQASRPRASSNIQQTSQSQLVRTKTEQTNQVSSMQNSVQQSKGNASTAQQSTSSSAKMAELLKPVRRGASRQGSTAQNATSASSQGASGDVNRVAGGHSSNSSVQQFTLQTQVQKDKVATAAVAFPAFPASKALLIDKESSDDTIAQSYQTDKPTDQSALSQVAVGPGSKQPSTSSSAVQLTSTQSKEPQDKEYQVAKEAEQRRQDHKKGLSRNLEVCDLLDMRDVQAVAEHAQTITNYLLREEKRLAIPSDFMQKQQEVTVKMRAFLIDQLAEHHYRFNLWPETLYVAVGVIDRFLALDTAVKQSDLSCLAITALHIAGKYEEIYPPDLKYLLAVTNGKVDRQAVLDMEYRVLLKLEFSVTFPSSLRFIERFGRLAQMNPKQVLLARYYADTALLDHYFVSERPSKVAAICIYSAQKIFKGNAAQKRPAALWNSMLAKHSGYAESDIKDLAKDLHQYVKKVEQSSLKSIRRIYSTPKMMEVAKMIAMAPSRPAGADENWVQL